MTDAVLPAAVAPRAASTVRTGRWPSVILGLAIYLLLICTAPQLLNDPDTQWHVAIGRWIIANAGVPRTDLFSHTFHGAPWIAKEWGSQLILATAYRLGGWTGVVAVAAAAIAFTFGLLHAWLEHRLRASVALALTLVVVLLSAPHFLARPHALALPVMVMWTMGLVAALERGRAPSPLLALLMVLWTNLHGSFPIGLVLAGVLAGEGVMSRPAWVERRRAAQGWALFLALSAVATLATPYGWHAILVPLQMAGSGETLPFISEWQPLALDREGIPALALLAVALLALGADTRKNLFRIVAVLILGLMMIRHSRFVGQFAILAPILFAAALAARFKLAPAASDRGRPILALIAGGMALAALGLTVVASPTPDARMTPEAAFRAAKGLAGPVYNDYDFGGFLIAQGVPTFIDGRTDQLFLGGFLPRLDAALRAPSDDAFAALLAKHKVTWALVRPGSDDARHLSHMPGWAKLYQDDVAAVFSAHAR